MEGCIYRAFLADGRSYIGQTTNYQRRHTEHWENRNDGSKFHNAVLEYGWDSFSWEILEVVDEQLLNDREVYWIAYYDSFRNGFNNDKGGGYDCNMRGRFVSDETKKKQSIALKGKKSWNKGRTGVYTEEQLQKMRIPKKEEHKQKLSKPKSEETRQKMSEWQKGKPKSEEAKQKMKEAWVRRRERTRINTLN